MRIVSFSLRWEITSESFVDHWKEVVPPMSEAEADEQFVRWLERRNSQGEIIEDNRSRKDYMQAFPDGRTLVRYCVLYSANDS